MFLEKQHSWIRGLLGIILGIALIVWPRELTAGLFISLGGCCILAGLYSLAVSLRRKTSKVLAFTSPFAAAGCIVLGAVFAALPFVPKAFFDFDRWVMYIILYAGGLLLCMACIRQLITLGGIAAEQRRKVPVGYYVLPALIPAAMAIAFVYLSEPPAGIFIFLGVAALLYGINEIVCRIKFRPEVFCRFP
ncbi:MAG: DUF308 domain-containing protein [Bacteroidales bacterium]